MRRAGYEVRLEYDLEESYEEGPATLLQAVARHRRWCQGSLQHTWLLFTRDLHVVNRCHFLLGIFTYASSLLWLFFLILSTLVVVQFERSGLTLIPASGFTRFFDLSLTQHGAVVFAYTFLLLLSPKYFSLLDLLFDRARRRAFGGWWLAAASVVIDTVVSFLLAPIYMCWMTLFLLTIPLGKGVRWDPQNRSPDQHLTWKEAADTHGWLTLAGLTWGFIAFMYNGLFFLWMLPIVIPLALSIPLNVMFSSTKAGEFLLNRGLLLTPEERKTPREVLDVVEAERKIKDQLDSIGAHVAPLAIVDPYVNALHVSLQRDTNNSVDLAESDLGLQLFKEDFASDDYKEHFRRLLVDGRAAFHAHTQFWRQPEQNFEDCWRDLISRYPNPWVQSIFPVS